METRKILLICKYMYWTQRLFFRYLFPQPPSWWLAWWMTSPPSPPGVAHLSSLDNGNDLNSTCWDLLMLYTRTVAKGSSLAAPCPPPVLLSAGMYLLSRTAGRARLHSCIPAWSILIIIPLELISWPRPAWGRRWTASTWPGGTVVTTKATFVKFKFYEINLF